MSVIYAPLNAVSKHRTIRTILPGNITLTSEEYDELLEVERAYTPGKLPSVLHRETTNQGLFYFMLENNLFVLLAKQKNLTKEIIFLAHNKLIRQTEEAYFVSAYLGLLSNPATMQNRFLANLLFSTFSQHMEKLNADFLADFLKSWNISGSHASTDVLVYFMEQCRDKETSFPPAFLENVNSRKKEIMDVFASSDDEEYRMLSQMPFTWVLGMFGHSTNELVGLNL